MSIRSHYPDDFTKGAKNMVDTKGKSVTAVVDIPGYFIGVSLAKGTTEEGRYNVGCRYWGFFSQGNNRRRAI